MRAEHVFGVPGPEEDMLHDIIEIHQPSTYPRFGTHNTSGVVRNITPSNLGGFVWPGHKDLKLEFVILSPPHQKHSN